jgi:hypothetical protein
MACVSPRGTRISAAEEDGQQQHRQPPEPHRVLFGKKHGPNKEGGDGMGRIRGLGRIAVAAASDNATCLLPRDRLVRCFEDMGTFQFFCDRCVADSLPTPARPAGSCRELGDGMCAAIYERCPCGLCSDEVEAFLDCAFRVIVDCPLECPGA